MKKLWKFFRGILIIVVTVVLSTIVINATDNSSDLGNSLLGSVINSGEQGGCPKNMVFVPNEDGDFCIDMYEASPSDGCLYTTPQTAQDTAVNLERSECQAKSVQGKVPWTFIARHQAELACAAAGKRLPTTKEWYRAALGTPDNRTNQALCNNQSSENTASLSGSFDSCVSSAGAFDMVGNVWEWVSGTVKNGAINGDALPGEGYVSGVDEAGLALDTRELEDPSFNADYFWINTEGTRGILRGGYFKSGTDAGIYSTNTAVPSSFLGIGVGFRCVK